MNPKHFFIELGIECFEHLKATNPGGGIREFIRTAVEYGYKKALEDKNPCTEGINLNRHESKRPNQLTPKAKP